MIEISQKELNSPSKFRDKLQEYIKDLKGKILKTYNIEFEFEELSDLLLSACRSEDFNVIYKEGRKKLLDKNQVEKWINEKLIPNTIILRLDDEDVLKLLIFSIEITYQMFKGGTKATITQKGFRERRRTFESILVDQFIGKLGEIFTKRFLEDTFKVKVELDWEISKDIEKHRNDIINAKKKVSIKSSPNLAGIWAEADKGYDYGIMVKCSVPQQPILQFFIEVCGFSTLLNFAEKNIKAEDSTFRTYIEDIRERVRKYKCGEIQTSLKGFICGYFKTSEYKPRKKGKTLEYLGKVREERYLVKINELKWEKGDWEKFIEDTGIYY